MFSNPLTHFGAWLAVLTMVATLVLLGLLGTQAPPAEAPDATPSLDVQFVLSGKVIIGAHDLGVPAELLVPQIEALQPKRLEERLAVVIIESRVVGPEAAVLALERLQAQGRTIGVISHVQAMKDRIPVQLEVTKTGGGASEIALKIT